MKQKDKSKAAVLDLIGAFENEGLTSSVEDDLKSIGVEHDCSQEDFHFAHKPIARKPKKTEKLISIAPEKCEPWLFADRAPEEMGDIQGLADSIKRHGQREPILIRPKMDPAENIEYEVIFGNRRWQACCLLGIPVKAILKEISNAEAAVSQKEENENRQDLSDFSRAKSYQKLLKEKVFSSLAELAAKMGVSKTHVSDILSYTKINHEILQALPQPHKLKKKSAIRLATMSKNIDTETLRALVSLAPEINSGKITASKIAHCVDEKNNPSNKSSVTVVEFNDGKGKLLFYRKTELSGITRLVIGKEVSKKISLEDLDTKVNHILKEMVE